MGEEWNGAWADKFSLSFFSQGDIAMIMDCSDARWDLVSEETKKWLNFVRKKDGEFWMCYKDFVHHFQEVGFGESSRSLRGDMKPGLR